ncbi:autotransporter-associated beta strand repeat-containing protein [Nitrincola schmidtii]|uniref:autotransporter-associated beta strand repeat-containing protein n=1 Tax=Nitrincola schmidtii TaxID=1730894 RepID=UPI00124F2082|nr:autotransporter-associated beta strand repeat-containing protein [Nitrincola schmidtii]
MNKTYRLVWKASMGAWVVVSEIAKACGKRSSRALLLTGTIAAILPSLTFAQAPPPNELPTGGQVVAGQAGIAQSGANMNITQTSQRAAIDWQTFNVGAEATVNFHQPSSSAVTLNRVLSSNPSQIFGQINANGQVFLSNPNGVYFAPGSSVNVGGLVATTHSISNDDFMAGNDRFTRDGATGSVINEGTLTATLNGYIALLAPEVRNDGVVIAQMGTVALAAGESYQLQFSNSNTLASIEVEPTALAALVENGNAVQAPGGLVILSARAADQLQGSVVRNSGAIEAGGLVERGGRIVLEGDHITLTSDSRLGATGTHGGGEVLVGGDWQGGANEERRVFDDPHALHQATTVTMEAGATIDASATQNGDGGTVVLWSDVKRIDSVTTVAGTILAKGGAEGGKGGEVETSGYVLNVDGAAVSTLASDGTAGEWLLDPISIYINSNGNQYNLNSGTFTSNSETTNGNSYIAASAIVTALSSNNVTIQTTVGTGDGDIVVQDDGNISYTGSAARTLTLKAHRNVQINQNAYIESTSGPLSVVLWSDANNSGSGAVHVQQGGRITTRGGNVTIGGGTNPATGYAASVTGNILQGVLLSTDSIIDAGGGNISIRGRSTNSQDAYGIWQEGTVKTSGAGTINYVGTSDSDFVNSYGVLFKGATVQAATGAISITGTGGSGSNSTGVMIENGSTITTTSGAIGITGFYSSTGNGIRTQTGTNTIGGPSTTGAIRLRTDKINLGLSTSINTSGTLTVLPSTFHSSATMAIGTGTGTLSLPSTYFSTYFNPRISEITLGGSGVSGNVHVNDVTLNSNLTIWTSGAWTGTGTLNTNGNTITLNSAFSATSWTVGQVISGSGQLAKTGNGTVTLTGNNSYTGATTIYSGTLALGASDRISNSSAINVNGGILDIGSYSDTVGAVTLNYGTINGTGTLTGSSYMVMGGWINARLGGTAALTKNSNETVILTGANTYTGTTTINDGWLRYGADNVISTGAININGGILDIGSYSDTVGAVTLTSGSIVGTSGTLTGSSYTVNSGTISARLGGTGIALTKSTGGTVTLSGANTYTGTTTINAGTLQIGNNGTTGTLGSGNVTNNGSLVFNRSDNLIVANIISGNGSLTKEGGGILQLSGNNGYSGTTIINNGLLTLDVSGSIGASSNVENNSNFSILGNKTINGMSGNGDTALNGHRLTVGNNTNRVYSGVISGPGGITKVGNSTWTLSGANTYTGDTIISAGTLLLGASDRISNSSAINVNGGTFNIGSHSDTVGAVTLTSGSITGTGTLTGSSYTVESGTISARLGGTGIALTKNNTGTVTLSGANSYSGATTINAGILRITNAAGLGATSGNTIVATNGTLDLQNVAIGAQPITLNGGTLANSSGTSSLGGAVTLGTANSFIDVGGTQLTLSGVISGASSITKTGTGTLTLSGTNSYSGATTISAGSLTLSSTGTIANSSNVANSGTFSILGNKTIAAMTGSGSTALGAHTLTIGNASNTSSLYSGIISGTGSLIKDGGGTLTLGGVNTYTGSTTISAGTLTLNASGTIANSSEVANNSAFSILGNKTIAAMTGSGTTALGANRLTIGNASNTSSLYSGIISGTGGLTKAGGGTLTLTGDNTYSGTTIINSTGTLQVGNGGITGQIGSGAVTNNGSLVFNRSDDLTIADIITGIGSLGQAGTGILTLSGANTYTGATLISAGTLALDSTGTILDSSGVTNGGNFTIDGDKTIAAMSGAGTTFLDIHTLTIGDGTNRPSDYSGIISGSGGLIKAGSGTLTLGGVNTYTGSTTISAGTLALSIDGDIAASSGVANSGNFSIVGDKTIDSMSGSGTTALGGTLTIGDDSNNSSIYNGIISGAGGLTQAGTGTLTLGGINIYTGATTISAGGTLALDSTGTIATSSGVANGGTLTIAGNKTLAAMTGDGATLLESHTLTIGNATSFLYNGIISGTGGLTKVGGGTFTLGGIHAYSGVTTISAGTLALNSTGSIAASSGVANNGINSTFSIETDQTIAAITGNGATTLSGTLTIGDDRGFDATYSGVISGTGGLIKAGSGKLTMGGITKGIMFGGLHEYSGATTISAGELELTQNNVLPFGTSLSVASGATFSLVDVDQTVGSLAGAGSIQLGSKVLETGGNNATTDFAGVISGTGSLVKKGVGSFTLSGINTYMGNTRIDAGKLIAAHDDALGASGTVASGTTIGAGATLELKGINTAEWITLIGTLATQSDSGDSSVSGDVEVGLNVDGGSRSIDVTTGSQLTFLGRLFDDGLSSLTKRGVGTAVFAGNNANFSSSIIVDAGTLQVTHVNGLGGIGGTTTVSSDATLDLRDVAIGAEPIILNGGTLATSFGTSSLGGGVTLGANSLIEVGGTQLTLPGVIAGTGFGITNAGSGILTLGGLNTYTGLTTIGAGSNLVLNSTGSIAASSGLVNSGSLGIEDDKTLSAMTGVGTTDLDSHTLTIGDARNISAAYDGIISGTGGLIKDGSGILTLGGVNLYSGATAINAGTLIIRNDNPLSATNTSAYSGSGALTIEPASASFSSAFDLTSTPITGTLGGLTIGKAGNTANISLGAATVAGPIAIYGGDITLNNALIATGNHTITLQGSGNVTNNGVSGYLSADKLALTGSGNVTLNSTNNAIGTLAASGVGSLIYVNNNALTIGTVNPTGISATGPILIETLSGDLSITENIATTDTSANAIVLNAGKNSAAGDAAGGNIIVTSGKTVTVGDGGRATLFTGSITGSTGLTDLVGSGSGRFRYNSDETDTNYTTPLGAGLYAIYREQPNASGSISSHSITYGDSNPTFTLSGDSLQNGDGISGLTITNATFSTSSTLNVGSYTVDASGLATDLTALGYNVSGIADGTLTVGKKDLNVSYTGVDRVYDGTTDATVNSSDDRILGDVLTMTETSAFDTKDAGVDKTVNVTEASISGADAGNYTLIAPGNTEATIDKASATVIANSDSRTYNGLVQSVSGFTADGLVNGETIAVLSGVTTSGGSGTNVGNYVHSASGTDNNYNLSFSNGSLIIGKASATIIGNSHTVTYDGLGHSVSGFTISGLVNGEDKSALIASPNATGASGIHAGIYTNTVSGDAIDGNYNLSFENGILSISRRPITITADAKSKLEGMSDPALTFRTEAQSSSRGLVAGDSISGNLIREAGSGVGIYAIQQGSVTNASNLNYDINYVEANLTVSAVTLPPPPQFSSVYSASLSESQTSAPSLSLNSSDISVELVQASTVQQDGIVSVLVSKDMATAGAGFSFQLPAQVIENARPNALVQVTLLNGDPLPAWLRFIPETNSFIAAAVPDGAFPIQLMVTIDGRSSTIVISERSD